jgi:hypothetical protein
MTRWRLLLILALAACGDDDPVPIDEIPGDTKLSELSSAEFDGVCEWGADVSREKLPSGANCRGTPFNLSGCMRVPSSCQLTVGDWKACIPVVFERIAADPCELLDLGPNLSDIKAYFEEIPECVTTAACVTVM